MSHLWPKCPRCSLWKSARVGGILGILVGFAPEIEVLRVGKLGGVEDCCAPLIFLMGSLWFGPLTSHRQCGEWLRPLIFVLSGWLSVPSGDRNKWFYYFTPKNNKVWKGKGIRHTSILSWLLAWWLVCSK